jgi:hypothetical protein
VFFAGPGLRAQRLPHARPFLFRGNDVKRNCAADERLSVAAAQAALLIDNMRTRGVAPRTLTYELDAEGDRWYPSLEELHDGDRNVLIAVEQMPSQLSLGLILADDIGRDRS